MTTPTEADLKKAKKLIADIVLPRPDLKESVSLFRLLSWTEHHKMVDGLTQALSEARREGADLIIKALESQPYSACMCQHGQHKIDTHDRLIKAAKEAAEKI